MANFNVPVTVSRTEPMVQRTRPGATERLARIYCLIGAPWKPQDHLVNLWDRECTRAVPVAVISPDPLHVIDEVPEVGTFRVDHWRYADFVDAEAHPPSGGEVNVLVYHVAVDPERRVCQSCGAQVGRRP